MKQNIEFGKIFFLWADYTEEDGKICKENLIAIKTAFEKYSKTKFWINNKIFTKNYSTAFIDRIKKQIEINEELKPRKVISFSFSHYGIEEEPFYIQYTNILNKLKFINRTIG